MTLNEPKSPSHIPSECQWLAGEGAGSWFLLELLEECFQVTRFSPDGSIECQGEFEIANGISFDIKIGYKFTYLSHCNKITLLQGDQTIVLNLRK